MSALRGWLGEKMTTLGMWLFLDKKVYRRFHNVIVPTSNGTTQIDHLLVSPFGLFVIETKNITGWIFGSEDQPQWTQSLYGKKYSFQNPLRQNFRHTKCLADYLDLDPAVLHSVVFFIGECTFKTPMPSNVLRSGLGTHIRSYQQVIFSDAEIHRIMQAIQALKDDRSLNHRAHMKSLRERHASTTTCPKCGSALVERTAKKGANAGSMFLGCSEFPRCRYTKRG
ncbi:MAG: NERD domain-containing protein [Verrucomicrobiales bacterium]|nr:NERD domain-containing protein [Verrucomicrobiales bacterium]